MSPAFKVLNTVIAGAPRVSGDEPSFAVGFRRLGVCSPRERG